MTALAADKNTIRAGAMAEDSPVAMGVKASTKIYAGAAVVNDAGVAAPARTAAGLLTLGVARKQYDNTSGAANAIVGEFDIGDYWFVNDGGDPVLVANTGSLCYWTDDQTVSITATGKSVAGRVVKVDSTYGVLVRVGVGKVA